VAAPPAPPTIIHVTHWKAGSQWVRSVLEAACPGRIVPVAPDMSHLTRDPIIPGAVYTPAYVRHERLAPRLDDLSDCRLFLVVRDLRDTLVSWYYSLKVSHGTGTTPGVADFRARLTNLSAEDGLIDLIEHHLANIACVQTTWLGRAPLVVRYEDLLADEQGTFAAIARHCGLDVPDAHLRRIVAGNSFEARAGRPRGVEDVTSYRRKGVAGDWRNHFTPRVADAFRERFGQVLIDTGYERGLDW
jgi:hypothetical protein